MNETELAGEEQPQALEYERPIVAIVGRPNVGKSTLFNRLVGARWAITDDVSGVTRDRIFAPVEWSGKRFTLVDTGGYVPGSQDPIEVAVREQAEVAIEEADIIIHVCDMQAGSTDLDRQVAKILRRKERPVLLVANKADNTGGDARADEFFSLGLGDPFPVSAATGRRSGDLLDAVLALFPEDVESDDEGEDELIRVVLAGRPNVGKSTLANRLAGHQISIVHDQPGTTRDTTHIRLAWRDTQMLLMDTAGLRRRTKVDNQIEFYSGRRAVSSIEQADVVVLLVDAVEGCVMQEARIMEQVIDAGCAMVVAVNKWDIEEARGEGAEVFRDDMRHRYPFLRDYPIIFISGLTGKRVTRCLETIARVGNNRKHRVSTAQLNKVLRVSYAEHPPTRDGKEIRLLYATQHAVNPPAFTIFSNMPQLIPAPYKRYIENKFREHWGFEGTPLRIAWRLRREKNNTQG